MNKIIVLKCFGLLVQFCAFGLIIPPLQSTPESKLEPYPAVLVATVLFLLGCALAKWRPDRCEMLLIGFKVIAFFMYGHILYWRVSEGSF